MRMTTERSESTHGLTNQWVRPSKPEEKLSMGVHLLSAILRVTRWERLLIAQPCEATHVAGRCSVADARPSGNETRAILAVLSQAETCDRFLITDVMPLVSVRTSSVPGRHCGATP